MTLNKTTILLCMSLCMSWCNAQDPNRFLGEVTAISQKYDSLWNGTQETYVFTGSSSIRFWEDLEAHFPDRQIINSGFGGSQTSDLLYFCENLI
ncbi:MAG: G-D-S-L family lipolytic protein, partial [Flavobacteriaceae bacterium]